MIAVAGPRIDPASLGATPGVEVRAFVPDLYRHLIASDLAVVQGGLTTTMELVAGRRPFLYFPLANHFEQSRHVAHRLDRYGAGRRMDYATRIRTRSPRPSPRRSTARSRIARSQPTGRPARRRMIAELV